VGECESIVRGRVEGHVGVSKISLCTTLDIQRSSSWYSEQARVRAEMKPFCGSQNFQKKPGTGGFQSTQ